MIKVMMNKKMMLSLALAQLGLAGAAGASTYTNTLSETAPFTPFGLTLDSGSTAWETPNASLSAYDTGVIEGSSSYWNSPVYVFETIPAKPGVEGAINLYRDTAQEFYDYTYQTQSFDVSYSAQLSAPSAVPQSYAFQGQIENLVGAALVNGGQGFVAFNMNLAPQFAEPYAPGSGSATLSFKFGAAPEAWSYSYEKTFDLSSGSISLNDYIDESWYSNQGVNLSGIAYFEAIYTIDGAPGVVVDASSLALNVRGNAHTSTTTYTNTVVHRELVHSEPIPALAVPEAENYALMLVGLGLVGFMVHRRSHSTI